MSCVVSIPHDLLFLVANYLLPKERQNKLIFRYSYDWRNFINTSKEYFREWKKQTQLIVLDPEYALKFIRSLDFSDGIIQLVEDSLHQLELRFLRTRFQEHELHSIDRVKCFSAVCCTIPKIPQIVSHLSLDACDIDQFSCDSVITNLELINCTIRSSGWRTVDLRTLTITEEASFSGMDLQNYQSLSSLLKSVSVEDCDSISDVSCFSKIQKLKFANCPNITDVSCLGDVRELSFWNCQGITDVSSL
jgi:hypothetical protein